MKTIISKDLSSTLSPTAAQLVKVAADGEWFVWVPDRSHSHTNKAMLDQITFNPVETIVAWLNVTLVRVGNTVTIASSEAGSSGFIWMDPDINNLASLTSGFLFADKRSSAHTYDNTSSGIVSTNVQWAIDEVEARVDTAETNITTLQTDVSTVQWDITTVQWDITTLQWDITTVQWDITALQTSKLETVSDTNSIDLTKTGVNVSADLKLDASSNNLLSVSGAGTFADERAIAHTYDPTASGLTATNVQAAIDEVEALLNSRMPTPAGVLLVDGWQTPIATTTHTLTLADYNTTIVHTNASASTITVPPNSSVAFPINTQIDIVQNGAGKVTLAQWAGVTINSKWWNKSLAAQYTWATLKKVWTDTWILFGELIA